MGGNNEYNEEVVNEDGQPGVIDSVSQSATHMAGKAAAEAAVPGVGGKIYDIASNTELGQALEKKVAKEISLKIRLIIIGISFLSFIIFFTIFAVAIDDGWFDSDSDDLASNGYLVSTCDSESAELLAKIIYHEVGEMDLFTQLSTASVVLNNAGSGDYDDIYALTDNNYGGYSSYKDKNFEDVVAASYQGRMLYVAGLVLSGQYALPSNIHLQASQSIVTKYGSVWTSVASNNGTDVYFGYYNPSDSLSDTDIFGTSLPADAYSSLESSVAYYKSLATNFELDDYSSYSTDSICVITVSYDESCDYENTMVTVMDYTNTTVLATVSLEDYVIGCAVFEIGAANGAYSSLDEDYIKAQYLASKTWLLSTKGYNSTDKTVTVRAATSDQQWCDLDNGCYTVNLGNNLIASYPGGYNGVSATSVLTASDLTTARKYYSEIYGELYLPTTYDTVISSLNSDTATYYVSTTQDFWRSKASTGTLYDEILKATGNSPGQVGITNWGVDISTYYADKDLYQLSTYCKVVDGESSDGLDDVTYPSGGLAIPSYYQEDYADVYLSSDGVKTVASSGCGFTSVAMVVSYLLDEKITPRELVDDWSRSYYVYDVGMSHAFPAAAAAHYGLGSVKTTSSISEVYDALKAGHPVISSQSAGLFTTGGHIIVLRGVTSDGKILVNDPLKSHAIGKGYNSRAFTLSEIDAAAGTYFIFPTKGS